MSEYIPGSLLRALEGVGVGAESWSLSVSQEICFWEHPNAGVLGPSALAGWKCSMPHGQRATPSPHWKVMMALESTGEMSKVLL